MRPDRWLLWSLRISSLENRLNGKLGTGRCWPCLIMERLVRIGEWVRRAQQWRRGWLCDWLWHIHFCRHTRYRGLFHHRVFLHYWQIKVGWKTNFTSTRKYFENMMWVPSVLFLNVVVWAVRLDTWCAVIAFIRLIIIGMEFLLLPTMAETAFKLIWTALTITCDNISGRPVGAQFFGIREYLRFSPEILPIVRINANVPLMIILVIRTPNCFEMVQVEIGITSEIFNQFNSDFFTWMSERAELSIFTFVSCAGVIRRAEFGLVFVRMVKLFNTVMREWTLFSVCALLLGHERLAPFRLVCP